MGKADEVLKDMIRFHGKRIAKDVVGDMPAQMKQARQDIRSLQKAMAGLTKQVDRLLEGRRTEAPLTPASDDEVERARFTKRTLPAIRKRFSLTQQELAKLLGVAAITVNSWERGRARPRGENVAKIIALRSMGQGQVDGALGREPAPPSTDPQQIRDLRGKLGLTQRELAKLLAVSGGAVTSWEMAKSAPGRNNRKALAELGTMTQGEVDERLGRTTVPGPATAGVARRALSPAEILRIRKNAGLSQRGMAKALGASVNSVCNWEKGHSKPRANSLEKLLALRE